MTTNRTSKLQRLLAVKRERVQAAARAAWEEEAAAAREARLKEEGTR